MEEYLPLIYIDKKKEKLVYYKMKLDSVINPTPFMYSRNFSQIYMNLYIYISIF